MNSLIKLKTLVEKGKSKDIKQALSLATALFDRNSKEMKEFGQFLVVFFSDKIVFSHWNGNLYDRISDNKWGVWLTTYHEDSYWHKVDIHVPLVVEAHIVYRNGNLVLEVTLDWGWRGKKISLMNRVGGNYRIKPTPAHIKIIENELKALPVTKEVILNDFENPSSQAISLLSDIKHPLQHSLTFKAAIKIGESL